MLLKLAIFDEFKFLDSHSFLTQRLGEGRHAARRDASYIGVVPSRGQVHSSPANFSTSDYRKVRQMRASCSWVIGQDDISNFDSSDDLFSDSCFH